MKNGLLLTAVAGGVFGFLWSFIGPAIGIPVTEIGYWVILFVGAMGIGVIGSNASF